MPLHDRLLLCSECIRLELFCQSSDLEENHTRITLKRIISYNLELRLSKTETKETLLLELAFICYVHISATWNISKHFADKGMNDNKQRVGYDTERWSKCRLFVMYTYLLRRIFQSTLEIRT